MDDELRRALQGLTDDVAPVSSAEARDRASQARLRPVSQIPMVVVLVVFVLMVGGLTVRVVRTSGPGVEAGQSTVADDGTDAPSTSTTAPPVVVTTPDQLATDGTATTLAPTTTLVAPASTVPSVTSPGAPPSTVAAPPETTPGQGPATTTSSVPGGGPTPETSSTTSTTAPPAAGVVLRGDGLGLASFGQDTDGALAALDQALTSPASATVAYGRTADTGFRDQVDTGLVRTVSWGTDGDHPALTVQLLQRTSGTGPAGLVWWSYTPVAGFPVLHTAAGLAPPTTRAALLAVVTVEDRSDPAVDSSFPCFSDRRGTVCAIPAPSPADPTALTRFVAGTSARPGELSVTPPT